MRVALVTGAGRNIGRAIARDLARAGHLVVLNGRRSEPLETVRQEIEADGGRALVVPADVSSPGAVDAMAARVLEEVGAVDVLVNNAVVRSQRPLQEMPVDEWRAVLDVGLTGAFLCTRAFVPRMTEGGWGRIVYLAGVSGQSGVANRIGVSTAKAGLIGMTRAVAAEVAGTGVTANAISPGGIDTDRRDAALGDPDEVRAHYERRAALIPVQRRGTVGEVAALCRYLVGDEAGFMTGQVLNLNGGTVMA